MAGLPRRGVTGRQTAPPEMPRRETRPGRPADQPDARLQPWCQFRTGRSSCSANRPWFKLGQLAGQGTSREPAADWQGFPVPLPRGHRSIFPEARPGRSRQTVNHVPKIEIAAPPYAKALSPPSRAGCAPTNDRADTRHAGLESAGFSSARVLLSCSVRSVGRQLPESFPKPARLPHNLGRIVGVKFSVLTV